MSAPCHYCERRPASAGRPLCATCQSMRQVASMYVGVSPEKLAQELVMRRKYAARLPELQGCRLNHQEERESA